MIKRFRIPFFDLVASLSDAMDLVTLNLANHHNRVAYIAASIADEYGLTKDDQDDLLFAGVLHDIGALSRKERIDTLTFHTEHQDKHSELGYLVLKQLQPLSGVASIIRHHHVSWANGEGCECQGEQVLFGSHILRLADRVDVLIDRNQEILQQVEPIRQKIRQWSGEMFMPELVEVFLAVSSRECFWFDIVSPSLKVTLSSMVGLEATELDIDELIDLSNLFRQIIDFRSRFTAAHSSGVASCAEALAKLADFSGRECKMMRVAGYLHDLGKLAVPTEILEKSGKLTADEFNIVKTHPFLGFRLLEPVRDLDVINAWASFHHERMDGTGYPFHHDAANLPLGSRIVAVADVYTALAEDRPYRRGLDQSESLRLLRSMGNEGKLDMEIVSSLSEQADEVDSKRLAAQAPAESEYERLLEEL
jgi:HD-GYP domain-containing protein (c-di-GMP phosphodiesterase class II)